MWFDILKDSKQVSRTMGSIDWENEEIPEETNEDCLQWVKDFNGLIEEFKKIINSHPIPQAEWYITSLSPSQEHNETVCKVFSEIKELESKGWDFNEDNWHKLGEERDWNSTLDTSKGVSFVFMYYDGDGYQAILEIIKDGETIIDSVINSHGSEPFNDFFFSTLYDNEPNPDYQGDKKNKELVALLKKINKHFQKIAPSTSRYLWESRY
jgi:hypothetical protein